MKKIIILIILGIVGGALYYAISPLFNNIEVNDELPVPVENTPQVEELVRVPSGVEKLSDEDKVLMEQQIAEANLEEPEVMTEEMPTLEDLSIELAENQTEQKPKSVEVIDTLGHPAEGTVKVIDTAEGQVIRFEDFETINGPRLHLYLSKDLEGTDFIDLGLIRGTKGNINYVVPEGVDLSEYRYVMHWCVPFGVLFNYADIGNL